MRNKLDSLLDSFKDVIVSNRELHPRISHLQGGMDAFHWRKAWLRPRKSNREDPFAVAMKRGTEFFTYIVYNMASCLINWPGALAFIYSQSVCSTMIT